MADFRTQRQALRISLSALARMARVSRYRLVSFELGGPVLSPDEQDRIAKALQREAQRLVSISQNFNLVEGVVDAEARMGWL